MRKTKVATNAELAAVLKILSSVISDTEKDWPVPVGFRILQNVETLQKDTEAYRRERERIIYKFSPDGKVGPETEGYEECKRQLAELDAVESEVTVQLLTSKELEGMKIPLAQLVGLRFITAEPVEDSEEG